MCPGQELLGLRYHPDVLNLFEGKRHSVLPEGVVKPLRRLVGIGLVPRIPGVDRLGLDGDQGSVVCGDISSQCPRFDAKALPAWRSMYSVESRHLLQCRGFSKLSRDGNARKMVQGR